MDAVAGYPRLVADIGGTNARFALQRAPGAPPGEVVSLRVADYAGPQDAALDYLARLTPAGGAPLRPAAAALAIATAIEGETVQLTNSHWRVSRAELGEALGAGTVLLLNDFEALALALPALATDPSAVEWIGPARADRTLPMAVVGPGTGLGVAACVPVAGGWVALAAEGGHVTACACDDFEAELLAILRRQHDHVSAERLLSGIGLPALYRAVCELRGVEAQPLGAEQITSAALAAGSDRQDACRVTLDTFCAMLGSFAGNVALTVGARGGVFVAGGIAQKLRAQLGQSRFRERFEAKGRFAGYLARIATGLIVAPHAALHGAAQALAQQPRCAARRANDVPAGPKKSLAW